MVVVGWMVVGGVKSFLCQTHLFGQVNHNIIGTQNNKKIIDHLEEPGGTGGSQSPKLTIFDYFQKEIISLF